MTGKPMAEMIAELGLTGEFCAALQDAESCSSVAAVLLRLLFAYERGNWDSAIREAQSLSLDPAAVARLHSDCTRQSHRVVSPPS